MVSMPTPSLSRRALLAALGLGGVGASGAACSEDGGSWRVEQGTLESEYAVGGAAGWFLARPPGGGAVPLIVLLHGTAQSAEQVLQDRGVVAAAERAGLRMALAAIDAESSYWHARDDGSDTGALVLDAFLPLLAERGVDTARPAWFGWSMGGFGALLLASRLEASGSRSGPVLMSSPAIWPSWRAAEGTIPGAFDTGADWRRQMELLADPLRAPIRIDVGRSDPFLPAVRAWAERREVDVRVAPGGHSPGFSTRLLPEQLRWLGRRTSSRRLEVK